MRISRIIGASGYAIVRGFFDAAEIAEIGAALDQLYAEGAAHGRCFRHGNLFYNVAGSRRAASRWSGWSNGRPTTSRC